VFCALKIKRCWIFCYKGLGLYKIVKEKIKFLRFLFVAHLVFPEQLIKAKHMW